MASTPSRFLAYGGWFEDKVGVRNDNNFVHERPGRGDRTPHPGLFAFKYVYRYLHAIGGDLARVTIRMKNWHDFVNAADVAEGRWAVMADGETVASGSFRRSTSGRARRRSTRCRCRRSRRSPA